jgi:hypothetical protein
MVSALGFSVAVARADVFEVACKWSGRAGEHAVPQLWLIDPSAKTVTYEGSLNQALGPESNLGEVFPAQISQDSIDWNPWGSSFHLNRYSGLLSQGPNIDTMDCWKVQVQALPTQKF